MLGAILWPWRLKLGTLTFCRWLHFSWTSHSILAGFWAWAYQNRKKPCGCIYCLGSKSVMSWSCVTLSCRMHVFTRNKYKYLVEMGTQCFPVSIGTGAIHCQSWVVTTKEILVLIGSQFMNSGPVLTRRQEHAISQWPGLVTVMEDIYLREP